MYTSRPFTLSEICQQISSCQVYDDDDDNDEDDDDDGDLNRMLLVSEGLLHHRSNLFVTVFLVTEFNTKFFVTEFITFLRQILLLPYFCDIIFCNRIENLSMTEVQKNHLLVFNSELTYLKRI